jgi:hypothetical protein
MFAVAVWLAIIDFGKSNLKLMVLGLGWGLGYELQSTTPMIISATTITTASACDCPLFDLILGHRKDGITWI